MPNKYFHFPSSSDSYSMPSGDSIRFKIYYSDTADSNTDSNVDLIDISQLNYPFETDPSDSDMRFADISLKFKNTSNWFETSGILNANKKNETFIQIYKNGNIFFDGKLIWDDTKKEEWRKEDSSYVYKSIVLHFCDKIAHLDQYTLADVSYTDNIVLYTLMQNIASKINLSLYVGLFSISECCGRTYGFTGQTQQFKIRGLNSSDNVITFLKNLGICFNALVFTQKGNLNFIPRLDMNQITLSDDEMIKIDKPSSVDSFNYIEVKAIKDWLTDTGYFQDDFEHKQSYGIKSLNDAQNFIIDTSGILDRIFIDSPTSNIVYPSPNDYPTGGGDTSIDYDSGGFWNVNTYAESGMGLNANFNGYVYNLKSILIEAPSDKGISFHNAGTVNLSQQFNVSRRINDGQPRLYKVNKLVLKCADMYNKYFRFGDEMIFEVTGIKEIYYQYSYMGKIYVPSSFVYDITTRKTVITARPTG